MKTYYLYVYCRRDDVSRDAGLHARCEVATDEEAIEQLRKEAKWLLRFYDTVGCRIIQPENKNETTGEGRLVTAFTLRTPISSRMDIGAKLYESWRNGKQS